MLVDVELSSRDEGLVRALVHVVWFERDPLESIDRALSDVVYVHAHDAEPDEYRAALDRALASKVALARLGPEYHPEVIVRRYLAELRRRLANRC
jgi:sugar phosphate isomerase/epimerase